MTIAATMLGRMITQYRDPATHPTMQAFNRAWGAQLDDIAEAIGQLLTMRSLQTATGAQLDRLGVLLAQGRNDMSDSDYRGMLQVRIVEYQSNGTVEDIIQLLLALGGASQVQVIERFPAFFQAVAVGATPPVSNDDVRTAVLQTKLAGVGVSLLKVSKPVFAFDAVGPDQAGWDNGHLAGPL